MTTTKETTAIDIETADSEQSLLVKGAELSDQVLTLSVESDNDYRVAAEALKTVRVFKKGVTGWFGPLKAKAHDLHKDLCTREKTALGPAKEAEAHLGHEMGGWERHVAEVRRKAEAEARRKAEEEALAAAEALEAAGLNEAADSALESAEMATPPVTIAPPKVEGISTRTGHDYRLTDIAKVNRAFLIVDKAKVRRALRDHGLDAATVVGGIEVFETFTRSVRT